MANSGEIKRYRRYKGWDYAKGASLFITIATAPRRALFGVVRDGVVVLLALGEKVKEALEAIPLLNPGILLSATWLCRIMCISTAPSCRGSPIR